MKKTALVLIILVLVISCKNKQDNPGKTLANSTGRFNELLVIASESEWAGDTGTELKKILTADVMGLPQPEPQFSIIRIDSKQFNGLLERTRNVLKINYGEITSFDIRQDVYARPQVIITLTAKDKESMIDLIEKHADELVDTYKLSDLSDLRKRPPSKLHRKDKIDFFNTQKLSLRVPDIFELVDDQSDFVWFRDETYDPGKDINGSKNIICYTLPLDTDFKTIKDSIASIRDKIGKKYLPGPKNGTYMITEAAYTPHIFNSKYKGHAAYKTLGKWEIFNSYMAGPFVSFTIEDKAHNRIIVAEGFVYAPLVNKRDFIFELEAVIGTLSIDD